MTAILSLVVGAVTRYAPDLFGGLFDGIKGWFAAKAEERTIRASIELEKQKGENAALLAKTQGESQMALEELRGDIASLHDAMDDRKDARNLMLKLHTSVIELMRVGSQLGLPRWILSIGWMLAVAVETLTAAVQPMIAATAFCMWASVKLAMIISVAHNQGAVLNLQTLTYALTITWGEYDKEIIAAVLGFFLAHRAQKYNAARQQS